MIFCAKIMISMIFLSSKTSDHSFQRQWAFLISFLDQGQEAFLVHQNEILSFYDACLRQSDLEIKENYGILTLAGKDQFEGLAAKDQLFLMLYLFAFTYEEQKIQEEIKKLALVFEFDTQRLYLLQQHIKENLYLQIQYYE
jgi:hypothetical protein